MTALIPHSDRRVLDPDALSWTYELALFAWLMNPVSAHLRIGRAMDGMRVRKCEYVAIIRDSRDGLT
ncbi:MAG: hypothetical protein ACYC36_06010 [Bellilinea sp.]